MLTPLEKARKAPNSKRAKILEAARRMFGRYGFSGTTTRIIAEEAGIDVASLHYHWGEKAEIYEAVVMEINEDLRKELSRVEKIIHGLPLMKRISIALDIITSYLFEHPEIPRVLLYRHFVDIRNPASKELDVPMFISSIAYSMGLSKKKHGASIKHKMQVLTIMNAIYTFVSGADSFSRGTRVTQRDDYIRLVKETLKSIFVPTFCAQKKGKAKNKTANIESKSPKGK